MARRFGGVLAAYLALVAISTSGLRAQPCARDLPELRFDLALFVTDAKSLGDRMAAAGDPRGDLLRWAAAELDDSLQRLQESELQRVCELFSDYPELSEAPRLLSDLLEALPPTEGAGGCVPLSRETYLALFVATQVLKAAEVFAQGLCDAASCVPGTCSAVCPVTIGIARVLRIVSESFIIDDNNCGLETHYALAQVFVAETGVALASIDSRLGVIVPRLDAPVSSRASRADLEDLGVILGAGFGSADASLAQALASLQAHGGAQGAFEELDRRLAIEELLQQGRSAEVSSLILPDALGGELELVREIVADTIQMNQAVGSDVVAALELFGAGDDALNVGEYREAFDNYRLAYQAAARVRPIDN